MKTMKALVKARPSGALAGGSPGSRDRINDVLIAASPRRRSADETTSHIYNWDDWAQKTIPDATFPMAIGHEFVGRIGGRGRQRTRLHTGGSGRRGRATWCAGRCRNCLAGRRHLCAKTSRDRRQPPGGIRGMSSRAGANVWYCDPAIPLDVSRCFDPLGNATHSALSFNVLGEDVLITGAGPIGCMAAAIVRRAGAVRRGDRPQSVPPGAGPRCGATFTLGRPDRANPGPHRNGSA